MNTQTRILPGALLLTALLCASAQASISEVHGNTAAATVPLGDLDLATANGMSVARERVQTTARRLCHKLAQAWDLAPTSTYQGCVNDAVSSAMQKLAPASSLVARNPGATNKP